MKAIYPGSFDPITNGHLNILERALGLFAEVRVLVAGSGQKTPLLPTDARVRLIKEVARERFGQDADRITVERWDGLIMEYARQHQIGAVIRGLRAASDFDHEFVMATMNKRLNPEVETVFLMSAEDLYFVSSSMIKELFQYGGDVSPYVPERVARALKDRSHAPKA